MTPSGLQYRTVERSVGEDRPTATDMVRVYYSGRLIDGDEFDSSYSLGEPAEFSLNRVIDGWIEGFQLMAVGDTYEFTIPSYLAYGERGTPSGVGCKARVDPVQFFRLRPSGRHYTSYNNRAAALDFILQLSNTET